MARPNLSVNSFFLLFSNKRVSFFGAPGKIYSKNPYIRALNFESQAAVGSYLLIANSNIRLSGS